MGDLKSAPPAIPTWLDCDPGHDDAFAIIMATHSPQINLLGMSIVHGNDSVEHCAKNALRILWICGVKGVPVYQGLQTPLLREATFCPEIHGINGEDGVAGMCGYHFPDHKIFTDDNSTDYCIQKTHGVLAMASALLNHPSKVTVVLTGAQTNFAFCLKMFPEVKENIEKVVFMGGAMGVGNTAFAAEFNIQVDPEAASIVFHSGLPLVMVPLEVTHKVLATPANLNKIANIDDLDLYLPISELDSGSMFHLSGEKLPHRHVEYNEIFQVIKRQRKMHETNGMNGNGLNGTSINGNGINGNGINGNGLNDMDHENDNELEFTSKFAECCYKLLTFVQGTYCREFGFTSPPLHDPCTIFYLTHPECFRTVHMYVDVETHSEKCSGRTLCDINNMLKRPKNVQVCTDVDTDKFWERLLQSVKEAARNSPMN